MQDQGSHPAAFVINLCFMAGTVGANFFLGFPLSPQDLPPIFELVIGTPFDEADYVVESMSGEIDSGTTMSTSPALVVIDSVFEVTSSDFRNRGKGIRVRATGNNPIYVLVTIRYSVFFLSGYSAYLIHPNDEFPDADNYEYFIISTDYAGASSITDRRSNFLIVGNFEDTTISITPTQDVSLPSDAQDSGSAFSTIQAGNTHTVTIHQLQTLVVLHLLDLTGTKIVSDKPLTIITGHQCAQVPIVTSFCEPLYVQVPPTFNWGQMFLLAPFAGREASQQYKLVTSTDSTTVAYKCGASGQGLEIPEAGSGHLLSSSPDSYCYLTASSPVFLV